MKKQVKVLLLFAMIMVLALMTMLVSSAALDAEQTDAHNYKVSVFDGATETVRGYAATLSDAVAGATAGDTITVLKGVSESTGVTIDKKITIDGGKKNFGIKFVQTAGYCFVLNAGSDLTLQNTTISYDDASNSSDADMIADATNPASNAANGVFRVMGKGKLTIKDAFVVSRCHTFVWGHSFDVRIERSTVQNTSNRLAFAPRYDEGTDVSKALSGGSFVAVDSTLLSGGDMFSIEGIGLNMSFHNCEMTSWGAILYSAKGGIQFTVTGKTSIITRGRGIYPNGPGGEYNGVTYRNKVVFGTESGEGDDIYFWSIGNNFQVRGTGNSLTIYNGYYENDAWDYGTSKTLVTARNGNYGYVIHVASGASTVNVHGGTFVIPAGAMNGTTECYSAVIWSNQGGTVLNVHGGTFMADSATLSSGIYINAVTTVNITDVDMQDNLYVGVYNYNSGTKLTMSGGSIRATKYGVYNRSATSEMTFSGNAEVFASAGNAFCLGNTGTLTFNDNVLVHAVGGATIWSGGSAVNVTVNGGTFLNSGSGGDGSASAVLYVGDGTCASTWTVNGGFFGYRYVEDLAKELVTATTYYNNEYGYSSVYPVYITNPNATVTLNGGTFYCGSGKGTIRFQAGGAHATVTGGEFYGYAWLRMNRPGSLTVYGGSFNSNPGQDNCRGFVADDAVHGGDKPFGGTITEPYNCAINIYGGTYTIMNNADANTGFVYATLLENRDYKDESKTDVEAIKHTLTVNIYGGNFVDNSKIATHAMFYLASSRVTLNIYGAGEAIQDAAGKDAVSTGATFTKPNGGYVARLFEKTYSDDNYINTYGSNAAMNVYGGSFNLSHGTMFKAEAGSLNITGGTFELTDGQYFDIGNKATFTWASTADSRITFVLNQGVSFVDQFDDNWATCHFVLNSWMLDITQGMTFASLEELQSFIAAFLEDEVFSGVASYPYQNFYTELAADTYGEEQNLWMPLAQLPIINVNAPGKTVTIENVTGEVCTTFATVAAGTLVLNNCVITEADDSVAQYLVHVSTNDGDLVVNGGAYTNIKGGYTFQIGVGGTLMSDVTAIFNDVTVYCLDGGYGIVAYEIGRLDVIGGFITWSKDIAKGTIFDAGVDVLSSGTGFTGIYTKATVANVNGTTVYSGNGSAAICIAENTLLGEGVSHVLNVANVTLVGYRALYLDDGIANIYSGSFYSNPGQINHKLLELTKNTEAVLNIYDGTFSTLGDNANYQSQGIIYVEVADYNGYINIFGGTFINDDIYETSVVHASKALLNPIVVGTTTYDDPFDGSDAPITSAGATFVRSGLGYVFRLNGGGTVSIADASVTVKNGASIVNTADNVVFNPNGLTVYVGKNGVLPADDAKWATSTFTLEGSAAAAVLGTGVTATVSSLADAIALANTVLLSNWSGNKYIVPGQNLVLDLKDYVPFIVTEGATLTFNNFDLSSVATIVTVNGGTVIFNGGSYTGLGTDTVVRINAGSLAFNNTTITTNYYFVLYAYGGKTTFNGGSYSNTKGDMIWIRPGAEVLVTDGSFNLNGKNSDTNGLFYMQGGSLTIENGSFTVQNGGSVIYYNDWADNMTTATILIKDGTFTRHNYLTNGLGEEPDNRYAYGAILMVKGETGSDEKEIGVGVNATIEGGIFTSSSFVRIYTINTVDGTYTSSSKASQKYGSKVYVKGGTFIDNTLDVHHVDCRYLFQVARPGANLISITEECGPVTVEASKYTVTFFANASSIAQGSTFEVNGGTYKNGMAWIGGTVSGVNYTVKNANFIDENGTMTSAPNVTGIVHVSGANNLTVENCVFTLRSDRRIFTFNGTGTIKLTNCTVVQDANGEMIWVGNKNKLFITGGSFVQNGDNKVIISAAGDAAIELNNTSMTQNGLEHIFNLYAAGVKTTINGGYYVVTTKVCYEDYAMFDHSGGPNTTINGGTFVCARLFADRSGTVTVNGGLFVMVGYGDERVFRAGANLMHINSCVVVTNYPKVCVDRTSADEVYVDLDASAPTVTYAGAVYKVWAKGQGDFENSASAGASVFVDTSNVNQSGLRFETVIAQSVIDAITATAGYEAGSIKYYTLIAPADYVAAAGAFTKEALNKLGAGVAYVAIQAVKTLDTTAGVKYSGALVNLKSYTRAYVAVSMIEYVVNGKTVTIYGDYNTVDNARTAQQVAKSVVADGYDATWSEEQKAIVDKYATGIKG